MLVAGLTASGTIVLYNRLIIDAGARFAICAYSNAISKRARHDLEPFNSTMDDTLASSPANGHYDDETLAWMPRDLKDIDLRGTYYEGTRPDFYWPLEPNNTIE